MQHSHWRLALLIMALALLTIHLPSLSAQGGYPLPDLNPITAENVGQITQLARVGGTLPGDLVWLPDGRTLAIGTTDGVQLHDVYNLGLPPRELPGGANVALNPAADALVSGGGWWDTATWEPLPVVGDAGTAPFFPSPDGSWLATYTVENEQVMVRVWDATQHDAEPLAVLPTGGPHLLALLFHPSEPILVTATGSDDPYFNHIPLVLRLWDTSENTLIAELAQNYDIITRMEFLHDGELLLITSHTANFYGPTTINVILWGGTMGEPVARWEPFNQRSIDVSPDESLLVVGRTDAEPVIHLIDLHTLREVAVLSLEAETINPAKGTTIVEPLVLAYPRFSPDGRRLAVAADGPPHRIIIWDVLPDHQFGPPRLIFESQQPVAQMSFSTNSELLVTQPYGGDTRIWNAQTGELLATIPDSGDNGDFQPANLFTLGPNLRLLQFSPHEEGRFFWNLVLDQAQIALPQDAVLNELWSHAAYWQDGQVIVVNMQTLEETVIDAIPAYRGPVVATSALAGQTVFSGTERAVYDLISGELIATELASDGRAFVGYDASGQRHVVEGVEGNLYTLTPDGAILAASIGEGIASPRPTDPMWLYDTAQTDALVARPYIERYDDTALAFAPITLAGDTGAILLTGFDNCVLLWDAQILLDLGLNPPVDLEEGPLPRIGLCTRPQLVLGNAGFSPDGRWLAAMFARRFTGEEQVLWLWDAHDVLALTDFPDIPDEFPPLLELPGMSDPVFNPDGSLLAARAAEDDRLTLWDVDGGGALLGALPTSGTAVFSPDGSLLAVHADSTVTLWDVAAVGPETVEPLVTLDKGLEPVASVAFSPDGTLLYVQDRSGASLWGVAE